MITVGYRYNKKTKTSFNTFEGFHTLIVFSESDKRYSLSLAAQADKLPELKKELHKFALKGKDYITRAVFKKHRIRIGIRMTVDSETDREHLKEVARFITELCRSEYISPICGCCSRKRKTGLYIVGKTVTPLCDTCLFRKQRQYKSRRDRFETKRQSMPAGLIGAAYGAAAGAALYVLLYQLFPLGAAYSVLVAVLSYCGFVVAGRRATRKSALICFGIQLISFAAAEYAALVANMAIMIENEGGGIAVAEAIVSTNTGFADQGYLFSALIELGIGFAVITAVGFAYFLKRSLTRPTKISKNLL